MDGREGEGRARARLAKEGREGRGICEAGEGALGACWAGRERDSGRFGREREAGLVDREPAGRLTLDVHVEELSREGRAGG